MSRLVVGVALTVVSIVSLFSGCLSSSSPSSADAPSAPLDGSGNETRGATSLAFGKCTELDFVIPLPKDLVGDLPHGLQPKTLDPAGQIVPLTVQIVKCAGLQADGVSAPATTDGYVLYAVEPLPGMKLPQASGYYYLTEFFAGSPLVRDAFGAHGVQTLNSTIQLALSDVGPLANVHGKVTGKADDFVFSAETVMEGQPEKGAAGTLGVYMGTETLELHSAAFTAYSSYRTGQALVQPGLIGLPVSTVDAIATQGSHYWGFDLTFDLGGAAQ